MTVRIITDSNGRKHITTEPLLYPPQRNDVLEEVAKEFEKMKAFEKDTMASFAAFVRGMKR